MPAKKATTVKDIVGEEEKKTIITGTTSTGFEFKVDIRAARDFILGATIRKYQHTKDPMLLYDIINRLLGDEQEEALCRNLADADGYVSGEDVSKAITEIMNAVNADPALKN